MKRAADCWETRLLAPGLQCKCETPGEERMGREGEEDRPSSGRAGGVWSQGLGVCLRVRIVTIQGAKASLLNACFSWHVITKQTPLAGLILRSTKQAMSDQLQLKTKQLMTLPDSGL